MKELLEQQDTMHYQKRLDKITNQIILTRAEQQYDAVTSIAILFENSDPEFYAKCKEKAIDCLSYIDFLKNKLA